jgi:CRISPR type III-A-associated protein Csm2
MMSEKKKHRYEGFNTPFQKPLQDSHPQVKLDEGKECKLFETWPGYLQGGYLEDGILKTEFVSRAKIRPLVQAFNECSPSLTNSQLRRFFQHCRAVEARLRGKTATWREVEAEFRRMDAAAAHAFRKNPKKIPRIFHDFIQHNVKAVVSGEDFLKGLIPHFEAVVGFSAGLLKERDGR